MKTHRDLTIVFLIIIVIASCNILPNKFSDIELQRIYTFQYNRQTDSLIPYFKHDNPEYRAEAALSFSSIQDTAALPNLYLLLEDVSPQVRINAAFAIGQTKSVTSEPELIQVCQNESNSEVKRYMLEALGRCATDKGLSFLANYITTDSIEETGKAWGIYRASRRKLISHEGDSVMFLYIDKSKPFESRLASGQYFYRNKYAVAKNEERVVEYAKSDPYPEVRMSFTRVLRKINTDRSREALLSILQNDSDYRVRVDAANALRYHDYSKVYKVVWRAVLKDKHISVKLAAAEFFARKKNGLLFDIVPELEKIDNWRVRAYLYQAALINAENSKEVVDLIKKRLTETELKFEKIQLLNALLGDVSNLSLVAELLKKEYDKQVVTYVSYTLNDIRLSKDFSKENTRAFSGMIIDFLKTDNPYLIREAAHFILNPKFEIKQYNQGIDELIKAKERMKDEKDETIVKAITKAIHYLENDDVNLWEADYYEVPDTFKQFSWDVIASIPKDQKIKVNTEIGTFTIQMLVEDAPFTVAHFLDLQTVGFFNDMAFYRVIPNFVNQSGGATKPDFSSLADERIRSEFALKLHRTGTINMASLGRDTENSHFSIMLCPTPWNDNKYTIFAKVVENMEVVHQIEMGTKILSMELL